MLYRKKIFKQVYTGLKVKEKILKKTKFKNLYLTPACGAETAEHVVSVVVNKGYIKI